MPQQSDPGFYRPARDPNAPNLGGRAIDRGQVGRFIEPTAPATAGTGNNNARTISLPFPQVRTTRGSLVERDNELDFLEFHWNPESYSISKGYKWNEQDAAQNTPSLEDGGPELTRVSFELLLNDVHVHPDRAQQRTVEESLEWLFDRLNRRSVTQSGQTARSRYPKPWGWMNVRNTGADSAPPVLVLFGVSRPFECRLKSVDVTTVWQGDLERQNTAPVSPTIANFRAVESGTLPPPSSSFPIIQARVRIELLEYYPAPSAEEGS